MKCAKIMGSGSYLPEQVLSNADLEKIVDTSDEWIVQRVGIEKRHIIGDSDETVGSMAEQAAKRAIEAAGIEPAQIDMIIVGTTTGDYHFPSTACLLQHRLGIENDCPAFDVSAACSGFIYGLSVADQYIRTGFAQTILVVGVDAYTKTLDWTDRSTCVLFGDGAGAVILQASTEPGILMTHLHASGRYADLLYTKSNLWTDEGAEKPKLQMAGNPIFRIAVTKLDEIVDKTLEKSGLKTDDIDWLIPHQANLRIIQATARRLNLPIERVILTVNEHGNTSAASIPLALDQALRTGKIKRGEILMLEAFGAGLSWGSALVRY